jgi:hypothetical protein
VQRALGRPPRDFTEYAAATAATGVWSDARQYPGMSIVTEKSVLRAAG